MQTHKKFIKLISIMMVVVQLIGCSGGVSIGNNTSISGVVFDGLIEGANVFLDLNGNLEHDAGEPISNTTDSTGKYKIDSSSLTIEQLSQAILVTHIPETAKDMDDGGKTLTEASKKGFTLMAPLVAYVDNLLAAPVNINNAMVSPLTTLVANEITFNGASLAEARAKVRNDYDLNDDPMINFLAKNNEILSKKARVVAAALGGAKQSLVEKGSNITNNISFKEQLGIVATAISAKSSDIGEVNGSNLIIINEIILFAKKVFEQRMPATASISNLEYQKFVVVLKNDNMIGDLASIIDDITNRLGFGMKTSEFRHAIKGFTINIPLSKVDQFLSLMQSNSLIDFVEQDRNIQISPKLQDMQGFPSWGLDRIDQNELPLDNSYNSEFTGLNVNAYVLDTGILSTHSGFGNRVKTGYSAIANDASTSDCNGHGTHVAGIIGGSNYGVAKGVSLIPVRVLGCDGSGTLGSVIQGLDWVLQDAQHEANINFRSIVNLSLGTNTSTSIDRAVRKIIENNIPVIVAAGNDNANACNTSPAREPLAITVGATTNRDSRASYSNFGNCIDIFAPGSSITSTWFTSNNATKTLSGTSMAAPFVTGVAALAFEMSPTTTANEIGILIRKQATKSRITNLGFGSDNLLIYSQLQPGINNEMPNPKKNIVFISNLVESSTLTNAGWKANVSATVIDSNGNLQSGAIVTGSFTLGISSANCTTGTNGACTISTGLMPKMPIPYLPSKIIFSVISIQGEELLYDSTKNVRSLIAIKQP